MNSLWLICSVHSESGLASVSALHAILESIGPEVIFVEVPPSAFDDYFTNSSRKNLESSAIKEYRRAREVEIVPVDLPTPQPEFFEKNQFLFEAIERKSHEYRRLLDTHSNYVRAHGFPYLNSEHCSELWSEIYQESLRTIGEMADHKLVELYELWKRTIERRDHAMMENVLNYCMRRSFDRGVLLVGAAHRQSIVDKARGQVAAHSTRIHWTLGCLLAPNDMEKT